MSDYRCNICNERWTNCEGCADSNLPPWSNIILIESITEAYKRLKLQSTYHTISDLIRHLEKE